MLLAMAVVQAVSASPPERVDLTIRQPCQPQSSSPDEVVVCARTGESPYRIQQPPAPAPRALPKAEVQVAEGVEAGVETDQADVGGHPSNRAMLRLKVKF